MSLLNRFKLPAVAGILLVVGFISSCEQDLTTIGEGVIGGEPFVTNKVSYDVFAINRKIKAVQTNQLPIYQLGVYDDEVYGKTEASITSQIALPAYNPAFGDSTQTEEVNSNFFENETIDSVVVYLPFQLNETDSDQDGVPDALEEGDDILDATNDSDDDGIPNNEEVASGTNPLSKDTDGDTILDDEDDSNDVTIFAETVAIDSIYGNLNQNFTFKIEESTFFLRDLDPNSNFEEAQEYYSNQQFSPTFTDQVLYEGTNTISDMQYIVVTTEDDPETDDDDETVKTAINPGIRVQLDEAGKDFFQQNILDKEGSLELLSAANFKNHIRGLHLEVTPGADDTELLFHLDLNNAIISIYYSFDDVVDDTVVRAQDSFNMPFISTALGGNAINTFTNDLYPNDITSEMDTSEDVSRIYLKGGAGSYAEIQLFQDESEIDEIKAQNWIINEAHLIFYVDQEALANSDLEPPRLNLYNAETRAPLYNIPTENNVSDTPLGLYLNYDGILESEEDKGVKYTVNITEHLNNIIVRDSANATLGLQVTADLRITGTNNVMLENGEEKELPASSILTPLGTVLFGSNLPDENEKKLKLEIFYTEAIN